MEAGHDGPESQSLILGAAADGRHPWGAEHLFVGPSHMVHADQATPLLLRPSGVDLAAVNVALSDLGRPSEVNEECLVCLLMATR